jgi:hypothetical protein
VHVDRHTKALIDSLGMLSDSTALMKKCFRDGFSLPVGGRAEAVRPAQVTSHTGTSIVTFIALVVVLAQCGLLPVCFS